MTFSPFAYADSLRIGTIDFVSPDKIEVLLNIEAPDSVALNTGTPGSFPRINSYMLIPSDEGYLVGQVEWITIERSQYPKRKGMQDFGLIDLPYPLRKMKLNPLGTLFGSKDEKGEHVFNFRRGVEVFPSVGDSVILPTQEQLRSIVESGDRDKRRVKIGTSPLAGNANVCIDPDRLFGRHLAVLGNTGSGKSCSVAGLIRWCIEAVNKDEHKANARFIVLDPNGEYSQAFKDLEKVRIFSVDTKDDLRQLQVPLWFWNSAEWVAFTQASGKTQRPLLRQSLREIRNGSKSSSDGTLELRRKVSSILISLRAQVRTRMNYEGWKFGPKLACYKDDFISFAREYSDYRIILNRIAESIDSLLTCPGQSYPKQHGGTGYNDFPANKIDTIINATNDLLSNIGGIVYQEGPNEDSPIKFVGAQFADHIDTLANQENNPQFFDYLIMRIRTMLSDTRMKTITGESDITLNGWLDKHIGNNNAENGSVTIIDLSLVPPEIIHIITAVIARMTFEGLQRYRKLHDDHKTLPTVLVMEEAHTFVKRYKDDIENQDTASMCCQVFEKIAREGRKFGLGLVLSSQRPSELSPTVLSQCNTFLLHRISNDRDQELVNKLVPDNLRGLLSDLPSLPSQNAILLGWATELPVLVRMNHLSKEQRPQSDDPDFWDVWTGKSERSVDWKEIANDWQQINSNS
ncbi:ATPase [candidate division WOR-1 bacterium RIFOXYC2_FULL_37_10]|uniref:ATPase n=1 Tax=candidate division WOR-1 bacterium RIFOXYB2_FULL_37_13 TaxID=1802579 RepID=A0A1F4SUW0_UNCSA|nr:MAG: ATPase [candidate division WOR-1 bacterium RIFOXYB2_FULL_37_13]OGC36467.1 MAG: ATPase [candidate division WOR-1 bacterium RIFOXYC2_FULL_37_10]